MKELPKNFSEEKVALLTEIYPIESRKTIEALFPKYKWRNLQNIAGFLKLKKNYSEIRRGNLEILLNHSLLSSYWLGLFAADGTITEDCTFKIDLQIKDKGYLQELSTYLNTNIKEYPSYSSNLGKKGICRVKIRDKVYGKQIKSLFYKNGLKTYNPIDISFLNSTNNLLAFIVGYIDGDGSISKKGSIFLDGHINIKPLFTEIIELLNKLSDNFNLSLTSYKEMIRINFNKECSIYLNNFRQEHKLPVLLRKWQRI